MSDTIRERIMQNRLTALEALKYTDVFTTRPFKVVDRVKATMFDPPQYPALYLYPGHEVKEPANNLYRCRLPLIVEISVTLTNTNADAQLNALFVQVQNALSADISCGALAESCFESENDFAFGISQATGAPDRAMILATWIVKYNHNRKDPTKTA